MVNPVRNSVYLFPRVGGAKRAGRPERAGAPVWVPALAVEAIHHELRRPQAGLEGGGGVRDNNALDAAMARPQALWDHHPESDLATLAAAYMVGLTTTHPFPEGNLRIAFLTAEVFLRLNGRVLTYTSDEILRAMRALAAGELSEWKLADWLRLGLTDGA